MSFEMYTIYVSIVKQGFLLFALHSYLIISFFKGTKSDTKIISLVFIVFVSGIRLKLFQVS